MDASNIQPYQRGTDYNHAYDSSSEPSSTPSPYRQLHPSAQPLAQLASGTAAHGTQAQVLDLLRARAAALSTMQDGAMRTSAFETLVASVYEHDEQQRPGAMHVLLAQLPGLPSASRRDALNNLLLLCADVPAAARPGLYGALAQSVGCLPMQDRSPALRDIASGTRGIAVQQRAPALAAIAEALSALPDAQAQKTAYQLLRRLLEGVPAAAQLPVMEALAKVNWRDIDLGRDCAQTSLHALKHMADSPCAPLLALLAANLPTIPEAHRFEQFQAILAYTHRLTAQEQAGIQQTLRDALRHLPVQGQSAARAAIDSACMPAQSEMKPSALATNLHDVPRMNGRTFMQSITDAEKRSPVNRASALLQLAASLDLLSQEQRQTCFHALLEAARGLPPRQRGQMLERTAMEIGQLPESARAAAWQILNELAGNLPDQAQAEVLMCFCAAVSGLPEEHLIDAVSTLLARTASLAEPSGALGSSLAGIIASLPEHSRMAAVELMIKALSGMVAKTRFALGLGLAAVLRDLPASHRSGAMVMLLTASGSWPAKHRFPLLLRLAGMIPLLPQEAACKPIQALIETLDQEPGSGKAALTGRPSALPLGMPPGMPPGPPQFRSTILSSPNSSPQPIPGDKPTSEKARSPACLSEPDRAAILCAIGQALCGLPQSHPGQLYGLHMALECACSLSQQHWMAVLKSMLPGLLNPGLPAQPKPLMMIEGYGRVRNGLFSQDPSCFGPVQLVLDTCEILRSSETNSTKSLMLRPSTSLHDSLRVGLKKTTQQEYAWFLQQFMQSKNLNPHYAAAFLVPLLDSELDDESIVQHILARSTPGPSGEWADALFKPSADKSEHLAVWRATFPLVLGSPLSSEAKARALSIAEWHSGAATHSVLLAMAEFKEAFAGDMHSYSNTFIELWVDQIAASDLPPQLVHSLLAGIPVSDKTQFGAVPSTAVLIAIAKENVSFLSQYARCIARSSLAERDKVAMLSGADPRYDNAEEAKQCIRKSRPAILQHYREEITALPLTSESKQTLLELLQ